MRKESYSTKNGAQVVPMAKKGKQTFSRYKLELVEVPLRSAGSRTRVAKTQPTRHNLRWKTSAEGNPASQMSDVILRYDGVGDGGEVAKVLQEQQSQQVGSGADIGEKFEDMNKQSMRKKLPRQEIQEDYEKQVEKFKKDLEEHYNKYPQAWPANHAGPSRTSMIQGEKKTIQNKNRKKLSLN